MRQGRKDGPTRPTTASLAFAYTEAARD